MNKKIEKEMSDSIYRSAVEANENKEEKERLDKIMENLKKQEKDLPDTKEISIDNDEYLGNKYHDGLNGTMQDIMDYALDKKARLQKANTLLIRELEESRKENKLLKQQLNQQTTLKGLCYKYYEQAKENYDRFSPKVKEELVDSIPEVGEGESNKALTAAGAAFLVLSGVLLINHFKR